jgi:hypothetical protein
MRLDAHLMRLYAVKVLLLDVVASVLDLFCSMSVHAAFTTSESVSISKFAFQEIANKEKISIT